jgi:hypothetical protein
MRALRLALYLLAGLPSLLTACPMCTVSGRKTPLALYGAFLLLPYLVFGLGFLAYRRIARREKPDP